MQKTPNLNISNLGFEIHFSVYDFNNQFTTLIAENKFILGY